MGKSRSMGITEQEMRGARKGIPKAETSNSHCFSSGEVDINALGGHDNFIRLPNGARRRSV